MFHIQYFLFTFLCFGVLINFGSGHLDFHETYYTKNPNVMTSKHVAKILLGCIFSFQYLIALI
jgi:hypothetical protein